MNCNCNCNVIKSTSVGLALAGLIVYFPCIDVSNGKEVFLVICQDIPVGAGTQPVLFQGLPTYTRFGNILRSDQIKKGRVYKVVFGDDPNHFMVKCPVPCSSFVPVDVVPEIEIVDKENNG